ncbi:hypothetical protein PA08_1351 [Cutibacterium modestum P08]|nr:hypothetical protein PA08_1351 [Cutibacterium modestum P08]
MGTPCPIWPHKRYFARIAHPGVRRSASSREGSPTSERSGDDWLISPTVTQQTTHVIAKHGIASQIDPAISTLRKSGIIVMSATSKTTKVITA